MKLKSFRSARTGRHVQNNVHLKHLPYHHLPRPSCKKQEDVRSVDDVVKSLLRLIRTFLRVFEQQERRAIDDGVSSHTSKRPPKGHVAVYVGEEVGDLGSSQRFLVPVVYVNDPLFADLLKEAEEKNGFCHYGGISIPCPVPVFQSVRASIAAKSGERCGKFAICWKGSSVDPKEESVYGN